MKSIVGISLGEESEEGGKHPEGGWKRGGAARRPPSGRDPWLPQETLEICDRYSKITENESLERPWAIQGRPRAAQGCPGAPGESPRAQNQRN